MAGPRYSAEQLLMLKQSPLVQKPESLPPIEQWIDQPQEQTQRKPRTQSTRTDEPAPMGNFASSRPSLLQTRQTSRSTTGGKWLLQLPVYHRSNTTADDIVLGPPKISFASSRNLNRHTDPEDQALQSSAIDDSRDAEMTPARSRFFRDKDEKAANRGGFGTNAREKESWTAGRGSKTFGGEEVRIGFADKERFSGRNLRERGERPEGEDESGRRNGYGQKHDQRWSRDGDRTGGRTQGQERGGWREREKRPDREWERGGHTEKDPEWMDEPATKEEDIAHTADEFEQWKAKMRAGKDKPQEAQSISVPMVEKTAAPTTTTAPLMPEAGFNSLFTGSMASWPDSKQVDSPAESAPTPAKAPAGKGKSSRFASLFAPKEEVRPVVDTPASPAPLAPVQNGSSEDKEGFARMLGMLRSASMAPSSNPSSAIMTPNDQTPITESAPSRGTQNDSGRTDSRAPNHIQTLPFLPGMNDKRSSLKQQGRPDSTFGSDTFFGPSFGNGQGPPMDGGISAGAGSSHGPRHVKAYEEQRRSGRVEDSQSIFLNEPPRNSATPESLNIQSLLAAQRPAKTPTLNKDSEFLLNLIQAAKSSQPPSQNRQRQDQDNFQLFLDQPPKHQSQPQTFAPQPRAPAPGFLQDQHFQQQDVRPSVERSPEHQMRQPPQRPPPGLYDDPSIISHQSHHFGGEPRQQHGMPPFGPMGPFAPDGPFMGGPPPPHGSDRALPPPPGFPPNLRHPQGFANIPGIFQQQTNQPPPPNQLPHLQQRPGGPPGPHDGPQGQIFGLPPPPGYYGSGPNHGPGAPPGFPPMQGMFPTPHLDVLRRPQDATSASGMGNGGFDMFPGPGQQRR